MLRARIPIAGAKGRCGQFLSDHGKLLAGEALGDATGRTAATPVLLPPEL